MRQPIEQGHCQSDQTLYNTALKLLKLREL